ncbi:snRNA-activating protein complex subunit 4 isoform X2 [Larimichthys crocea]|uniref:snRNA-activating protein complex subunit 4 isoform X2 n=1 Tax=Larimichthys crocea TaxID=215358 RepID=UPI000901A665|nr:snRNA-activating protein complex subunit 4 isoform X2 [Larimichthys crocea]
MSVSLSAERDRIQRQVEELEQILSVTNTDMELLSSETDDESADDDTEEEGKSAAGLLAQRAKIQQEIQNLETILGPHSPVCVSDDDSSSESELGLSASVDSCLQMNLVYQQVVQETLDQLETLLDQNHRQQKEVTSQLSGPIKESSREPGPPSSCQQPINMFLGRFFKPYFKDKLTGLGPPANEETKLKTVRMSGCLENKKLKVKRWASWQKTLLIDSVSRDGLRRLIQPKLSRVDYLTQKLSSAEETDRQQLREQIDSLEREIDLLREKKEEELIGDRYEEHDWQRISNIDFEGTKEAEDLRSFWQNFLHPSINKSSWSQQEVEELKEVSRRHGERDWESIAEELGTGRTAFLCLQTFQRFVSDSLRRGSWTPSEDALLRELVDKMRIGNFIPYSQMSYFMEGRDPSQLLYRWAQALDPSLKRGPWTPDEDQLLLQAVSRYGEKDWWKIRFEVPGRTDSSCRDRYYDCLKEDIKRGPFDKKEQLLLLMLVKKHGVGRWAKIAAEIPHRLDAQCLREWRKLSKTLPLPAQKHGGKKTPTTNDGEAKTKEKIKVAQTRRSLKTRLKKVKEKEEQEETSDEEEEALVEYMDSDEEKKKVKKAMGVLRSEELEEEEKAYDFPPIQEWTSTDAQSFTFLSFRPVELPSSGDAYKGKPVRSTILGDFGQSVVIGPPPRDLQWYKRHSSNTMMMVSPEQLQAYLQVQMNTFDNLNGKVQTGKRNLPEVTGGGLDYELQAAVTPWIGNLLIPAKTRLTATDALRERGEKTPLSSTSVFLIFIQTLNVDSEGCKKMIQQRKNKVMSSILHSGNTINLNTVAGMLEKKRLVNKQQDKLILAQRGVLHHKDKQKHQPRQLALLQQPPLLCPPSMPPQHLLQVPPKMHPQMSPVSLFSHPASTQLMPATSLTSTSPCRPPPAVVTSMLPSSPHRLNAPPVIVVQMPLNTTSTCSASFHQLPRLAPAPSINQHVSIGSTPPSQNAVSSISSIPITFSSQPSPALSPSSSIQNPLKDTQEDQQAVCGSQNEVDLGAAGNDVGEACPGMDRAGNGVIKEDRRIRKPSLKAKSPQDTAKAKAKAQKKAASSPCRKIQIQNMNSPSQPVGTTPINPVPQTSQRPSPPLVVLPPPTKPDTPSLPVSVNSSQITTPASCSDRTVSAAPPPSISTNQHAAYATLSLQTPLHNDHDYTFTPSLVSDDSQHGFNSDPPIPTPKQPNQHGSDSTPTKKNPKAPPSGRKRAREEQPSVTSSQDDQCVGGAGHVVGRTGDVLGGAGTGVTQEGRRRRKPSEKVRTLQGAVKTQQAEAKKKKSLSSPPWKKRSCTSRSKQEVVIQNPPLTPLPSFCLCPGQSMWVMTPHGLIQLADAPPQGLQLALVPALLGNSNGQQATPPLPLPADSLAAPQPAAPQPAPQSAAPQPPPVLVLENLPGQNQSRLLPAPLSCPEPVPRPIILQPVSNPGAPELHPKLILPYKGTVKADHSVPPPLQREALQFDPSLMFRESQKEVHDWLSSQRGVVVPGVGVAFPYLPPFVSSLSTLNALLQARTSLTESTLQLLSRESEPRHPQIDPDSTKTTSSPDLPDSTTDCKPATDNTAPSVDLQEEVELVVTVRQLVAERFSEICTAE